MFFCPSVSLALSLALEVSNEVSLLLLCLSALHDTQNCERKKNVQQNRDEGITTRERVVRAACTL